MKFMKMSMVSAALVVSPIATEENVSVGDSVCVGSNQALCNSDSNDSNDSKDRSDPLRSSWTPWLWGFVSRFPWSPFSANPFVTPLCPDDFPCSPFPSPWLVDDNGYLWSEPPYSSENDGWETSPWDPMWGVPFGTQYPYHPYYNPVGY